MRSGIPRIAELAGVSIGTVDRALHGRPGINEQTSREAWSPTHLGDLDDLNLLGRQDELVRRLIATGKP